MQRVSMAFGSIITFQTLFFNIAAFLVIRFTVVNLNADIDMESAFVDLKPLVKSITFICIFTCLGINIYIFKK